MKLTRVKEAIAYRNRTGHKLPDDEVLQDLLFEALIYVAQRCEPSELLSDSMGDFGGKPLRMVENGKFIKMPEYPDFSKDGRHLMIDEELTYAVINYVMFLISATPDFKIIADEAIAIYRSNEGRGLYEGKI